MHMSSNPRPNHLSADALSRVSAHTAPPPDWSGEPAPFHGPLHAAWGASMRIDGIRMLLEDLDAEALRERLGIPVATDRASGNAWDAATLAAMRAQAEAERGTPWPDLAAHSFARFVRDGDRREYELAQESRQERFTRAVMMAAVTREPVWIDEAADGAIVLCEQSTWSLPAHDDAHTLRGFVVPDADAPYLDLVAGEIVAQLAVADRILGAEWASTWPGVRERIRREADRRVFTPFQQRDDLWWLGYWREVNNWNPWILGNTLLAAVLLCDDLPRIEDIIARALDSLDRYVATLPADGAIDEGISYWWNGAGRLLECLELVSALTDGALDGTDVPVVHELLRYPLRMQLGDGWYVNVGDGRAHDAARQPADIPFRWGLRLGDEQVTAWARSLRHPGSPVAEVSGGLPRLVRAASDPEWVTTDADTAPLPASVWLPSVQLLVRRGRAGSTTGLTLAAKGGTNDENHNHKDVGSFIVASDGIPLLVDAGKPTYTKDTFSARRYSIRAMQSGWHSLPAPHGLEQGEGPEFRASVVESSDAAVTLDLTSAYRLDTGERWLRTFRLVDASRIEIADEFSLSNGAPSTIHLLAAGEVTLDGDTARIRSHRREVIVSARPALTPTLEHWMLDDDELRAAWGPRLTRLTFEVTGLSEFMTVVEAA